MKTTLKITIALLAAALLFACSSQDQEVKENDFHVCAYVWPSCHDDSLAHAWLWEEGIGEWEVIQKGDKRFPDHYQPKQPLWGYELDDDPVVVEKWIQTALAHGVNTFIYDWYWFSTEDGYSGPYLESALDNGFLKAPSHSKMDFYIMWANHDVKYNYWNYHKWGDNEERLFNPDVDWDNFKKIVERVIRLYFHEPNYVKIDGCPVFGVFSIDNFVRSFGSEDEAAKAVAYFREEVKKAGFPDLHLQEIQGGGAINMGDAKRETMRRRIQKLGIDSEALYNMGGFDCDYLKYCSNSLKVREDMDKSFDIPVFPTVSIGWDDTPRFPGKGADDLTRFHNTPQVFASYLQLAKEYAESHPQQPKFIMINAWNEWVEGSYLLPDNYYGYGYLEAVKDVMSGNFKK